MNFFVPAKLSQVREFMTALALLKVTVIQFGSDLRGAFLKITLFFMKSSYLTIASNNNYLFDEK